LQAIQAVEVADPIAFNLKEKLLQAIDERFKSQIKDKRLGAATMIDPRFKKMYFEGTTELASHLHYLGWFLYDAAILRNAFFDQNLILVKAK